MISLILLILGLIVFCGAIAMVAAHAIGFIVLEPANLAFAVIVAIAGLIMVIIAFLIGDRHGR